MKTPHKEEIDRQGGICCPFLTQNVFSLAHFAPPELVLMSGCGENEGFDLFQP